MIVFALGALGLAVFVGMTIVQGLRLRSQPSAEGAERASRVLHLLFFTCLGAPFLIAVVYPGLTRLDPLAGLPPLPLRPLTLALGVVLAVPGLYLLAVSNRLLRALGSGANAFRLTRHVVAGDLYRRTRNPMSLGYYLATLCLSLLVGSTVLTLYVLLGIIPAHLLFLKFFEERELELRLGAPYLAYKARVPFLIPRLAAE
jgi:protein-S-isoprenylcysteine O-methyltransferase Ste14